MKKLALFFSFVLVFNLLHAQEKINWLSWEDAYAKAQKENKMILVDIISDNCKFCMKMNKITFTDDKIINLMNQNYAPVRINSDRTNINFKVKDHDYTMDQMLAFLTNNSIMNGKPRMAFPTVVFIYPDDLTRYYETGYQDPSIFKYMLINCVKEKARREKKKNKKK